MTKMYKIYLPSGRILCEILKDKCKTYEEFIHELFECSECKINFFIIVKKYTDIIIFQSHQFIPMYTNKINEHFIKMGFEFDVIFQSSANKISIPILHKVISLEDVFNQIPWILRFNKKLLIKLIKLKCDLSILYYYIDADSELLYDLTFLYNIYKYHNKITDFIQTDNMVSNLYYTVINLLDSNILNKEFNQFLVYLKNQILKK